MRENTLAAFSAAAEQGAPWVELDVRATTDRVPVVVHDPIGRVARADLPAWVPTLEEALDHCAALDLGVVVEVKQVRIAKGTNHLLTGRDQPLLVSSFLPMALSRIDAAPRALLLMPVMELADAIAVAETLTCTALHPHGSVVDQAFVDTCRAAQLDVMPWTVNERLHLERMRDLDVTAVITDDVPLAREVLTERPA